MKDTIERLRSLPEWALITDQELYEMYEELPHLLDRLEKLEALVEAAEKVKTFSGYLKEDGTYWIVEDLVDALAALEGDEG